MIRLNQQGREITDWFDTEVEKVRKVMTADSSTTLTAISNDAVDRLGVRLGPAVVKALREFGGRVSLGNVTPWSEY